GVEVDASVVEVVTAGEDAEDNEKPRELGFSSVNFPISKIP
ncbi:hypothetical protein CP8484711_0431B, partial [Chlamydia psittaci 84-8471/1]